MFLIMLQKVSKKVFNIVKTCIYFIHKVLKKTSKANSIYFILEHRLRKAKNDNDYHFNT